MTRRRVLAAFLILVALAAWLYAAQGDRWKDSVAAFDMTTTEDYRLRITGAFGAHCAKLEQETFTDPYNNWFERGRDCAWPRVADGDGWLAGGGIERIKGEGMILYGLIPAAAAEVEILLTDGGPHRIPAQPAGQDRFYGAHVKAEGDVISVRLRDANGGELRVY